MGEANGSIGRTALRESSDDVSIIAHRGFAGVYPENTLAAVRRAAGARGVDRDLGVERADAVEIDVMPSADGSVVVFHDTDLTRITDAPSGIRAKNVWEIPSDTLRAVEVLASGQTIPLLSTVLEAIPGTVDVLVELKNPGVADVRFGNVPDEREREEARRRWQPFVERVLDVAAERREDLLVSSFCEGALAAVREADPDVAVASVFWDSIADGLEVTRRYDCEAIHVPWNMVSGTTLFEREYCTSGPFESVDLVELAHGEGRDVNAWTVETWQQADELRRAGVDGLIADYPGLLRYGADERTVDADVHP